MINIYLISVNVIAFILYGLDKIKAILNKRRISEKALIIIALIGGSIGSLLGMLLFRHKIRKLKFIVLIPIFILIHLYLYNKYLI